MIDSRTPAGRLVDRLRQPQRIGLFGRRGVGKTTLLTLLYREAVGGRLSGIRLAAADAATAAYLADRIRQLEAGQPLPATLDQTELRLHLYADGSRVELVLFDYQGEHVALGRHEAIRDFLRDCDAVLLSLDAALASDPSARWTAEQEVEQLAEDYLAVERPGEPHRPMALVVTRADLLGDAGDVATLRALLDPVLTMTRHTLRTHCPWQGVFAVSSLAVSPDGTTVTPQPVGFDEPLHWLARAIRALDEARLERLWQIAAHDLRTIDQATRAFLRPSSRRSFRARVSWPPVRRPLAPARRRLLAATGVLAALMLVAWAYDAAGAPRWIGRACDGGPGPAATAVAGPRPLVSDAPPVPPRRCRPSATRWPSWTVICATRSRIDRLAALRKLAADPDGDPEQTWTAFRRFRDDFPDHDLDTPEHPPRHPEGRRRRPPRAAGAADAPRPRPGGDGAAAGKAGGRGQPAGGRTRRHADRGRPAPPPHHLPHADRRPRLRAGARLLHPLAAQLRHPPREVPRLSRPPPRRRPRRRRAGRPRRRRPRVGPARLPGCPRRLPGEAGRPRSAADARPRLPGGHSDGQYRTPVAELLRWCDRVSQPSEYRVVLESGSFSKKVAYLLSRGAYLSVEIEVAGVRYGPSTIIPRSYEPEWKYEFPRRCGWKLGDPVRVIVTDHYYWKRRVGDLTFDDDPLAMRHLSGEVELRLGTVTFSSDFTLPRLPAAE
ncbi:MAG: hypothetical protein U0736_11015 [Gemmataceae bacterium]